MKAGSAMNTLVSREVFGVEPCTCGPIGGYDPQTGICSRCGVPPSADYSGSIAAAWTVVEKLQEDYRPLIGEWDDGEQWFCELFYGPASAPHLWVLGKTAPEAICRAALASKGVAV